MEPQVIYKKTSITSITARWWFIALIPLIFFFSPPFVQKNGLSLLNFQNWFKTIGDISSNNFTSYFAKYSPIMNLTALIVIILVFVLKNKFTRVFSIYAAFMMAFYGVTQNTSYTDINGIGIITSSYIFIPILSGIWIWEAFTKNNNFDLPPKVNIWTITAFCFALFAFWNPINPKNSMPDFNPVYFMTNGSNSMFCTMTPMILAILFFFYPNINTAALRVTGLCGATIGFTQLVIHLCIFVKTNWWVGVLHIPVFILSLAAVILSFRADKGSLK
ncbi:hypothetical protein [Pseudobacteroides cellulosolvens]|uniref:Uncharacterized protein n=1 Tax=Pseudobacteroides cellulosolvens ATCC 35603 = DSM 2933 TaxID=398512 RepID=A0A0L6JK95_9FIRM|nr:hypothetical protein [Pseudobacteroides cellulosolvens]KNY26185.1 hypothetical protein Bccel_1447 [Pseudobacteroides cellulosolvens ATCC 35603 = DSM 2933]